MTSKDSVICPFCKYAHGLSVALGSSGLVCSAGEQGKSITCSKCKKVFVCDVEVSYKIKTRKRY